MATTKQNLTAPEIHLQGVIRQARDSQFDVETRAGDCDPSSFTLPPLVVASLAARARTQALETADELARDLRNVAAKLLREADRLSMDPLTPGNVNSLGLVQGAGLDIDRRCAILRERLAWFCTLSSAARGLDDEIEF